jgi:hypothetical protein
MYHVLHNRVIIARIAAAKAAIGEVEGASTK